MQRKISDNGIKLIKNFEGLRLTAYKPIPTETFYTIGYGHYGADVKQGMTITQDQAEQLLINDIKRFEQAVNNIIECNQNQFDALVSFAYNCGVGNLHKLCLGRTLEQIAANIQKYNKAGGKVLLGLERRRKTEYDLFKKVDVVMSPDAVTIKNVAGKTLCTGELKDGQTWVYIKDIVNALGYDVKWEGNNTVTVFVKP